MKNKIYSSLLTLTLFFAFFQSCTTKTDPFIIDPKSGNNNPNTSDNPAYKFTLPGNNGFDLNTVGLGSGNMSIPSLYPDNFVALYGRCDFTEGRYVMAIVAGSADTKKASSNFIIYFKNKPNISRNYLFAPELDSLKDTTAYLLLTDFKVPQKQKTWKATKGVLNFNTPNTASFSNIGAEDFENASRPLVSFSGSVVCK